MAQIGLKNLYYAPLSKDDSTGATYGTPVKIAGLISVNISPSNSTSTLHADDIPFAVASTLGEVSVTVEAADIPLQAQAALLGHTVSGNKMICKGSDQAPYVAILFESDKHDGTTRYVKLLKGKFHDPNEDLQTKGDSVEYQTPSIEGTFVCREYDGAWKETADSASGTPITDWYDSVESAGE